MPADLSPEQMLELVLNALPVDLFWKDRDSRILGCYQKFADDSGVVRPADLVGKTNFDFYPIDEAEAYRADDLDVINTGLPKLGIEEPLLLPNGETAWWAAMNLSYCSAMKLTRASPHNYQPWSSGLTVR